jgi:hypothetical protein
MSYDAGEGWRKEHDELYREPRKAALPDTLCVECRRKYGHLRPVTVSTRVHEMVNAVIAAALRYDGEEASTRNLTVCQDTLYRYLEKLEKGTAVVRDTILKF